MSFNYSVKILTERVLILSVAATSFILMKLSNVSNRIYLVSLAWAQLLEEAAWGVKFTTTCFSYDRWYAYYLNCERLDWKLDTFYRVSINEKSLAKQRFFQRAENKFVLPWLYKQDAKTFVRTENIPQRLEIKRTQASTNCRCCTKSSVEKPAIATFLWFSGFNDYFISGLKKLGRSISKYYFSVGSLLKCRTFVAGYTIAANDDWKNVATGGFETIWFDVCTKTCLKKLMIKKKKFSVHSMWRQIGCCLKRNQKESQQTCKIGRQLSHT